jgi:hypothetical protein
MIDINFHTELFKIGLLNKSFSVPQSYYDLMIDLLLVDTDLHVNKFNIGLLNESIPIPEQKYFRM